MYERALSAITIRSTLVKNRIASAAHSTMLTRGGQITDEFIAYHLAAAQGGVGLSILEAGGVHPSSVNTLSIVDDSIIEGYKALVDAVSPQGMRLFQQLWHGGHIQLAPGGSPPFAPSSVASYLSGVAPQPMSQAQIAEMIAAYAAAAQRCERGGLDGVEVHAGHGYLLAQFLSPVMNRRADAYGGDLENRMRLLVEILRAVRASVSSGFAVGVRLSQSADERILSVADVAAVSARLEAEGLIDFVSVSLGDYFGLDQVVGGMDVPAGYQLPFTAPPVANLRVPRLLGGRFRSLDEVEQALRAGEADMISMVRARIADPNIVEKSARGHPEEVRPCLACNQGCVGRTVTMGRLGCAVNAAAGEERTLSERLIAKAEVPRRVFIIGGGPAGMEAARIAALSGHKVILAEASHQLGGLLNHYWRKAPKMQTFGDLRHWMEQEVYRLGVEVRLSTFVEPEDVLAEGADDVIVAVGSEFELSLSSVQMPAAVTPCAPGACVVSAIDLFTDTRLSWGAAAVVVDDIGHYEAIACAEYLLEKGAAVTYVTRHKLFAPGIDVTLRAQAVLTRLYAKGSFRVLTASQVVAIEKGRVDVKPASGSLVEGLKADTVVWVGVRPGRDELSIGLAQRGISSVRIGDALAGRTVQHAIREGHLAARALGTPSAIEFNMLRNSPLGAVIAPNRIRVG
jgi:2,4-dienoyl-CoA reductase-like NADH-dependent reductase (Old Yellow Enzyme family)